MLTTLYCDASFCPETRVGGWAIWLRSDLGRIIESGVVPEYCTFSDDAELAAVYAGLYRAVTRWPTTHAVVVRSDSRRALALMAGTGQPRRRAPRRLVRLIAQLEHHHGLELRPRWVKGHARDDEQPSWLNRRVDLLAREIMRRERGMARRE